MEISTFVNPLVFAGGRIDGYISSRLMAAYGLDDGHVIHIAVHNVAGDGRISWHYVLERNGVVVFEGFDLTTMVTETYGDAARTALEFLTLSKGDTDDEFFDGYTPEQLTWRDEHAENLALFALDSED